MRAQEKRISPAVLVSFSEMSFSRKKGESEVLDDYSDYLKLIKNTEYTDKRAVNYAIQQTILKLATLREIEARSTLNDYGKKPSKTTKVIRREIDLLEGVYNNLRKYQKTAKYI